MFKLLRLTRRRFLFLRKARIGLRLLRASFRAVVFDHKRYALFCFLIALIQFIRLELFASTKPRLPLSTLITEYLIGQNFFEILADYFRDPLTVDLTLAILFKSAFFLLEIVVVAFITLALVYYISARLAHIPHSIGWAFKKSFAKQALILKWSLVELVMALVPALVPFIGDIALLVWQLGTALVFQTMAYKQVGIRDTLTSSFVLFKQRFSTIVSIDVVFDLLFMAASAFFYYLYRTQAHSTLTVIARITSMHAIILMVTLYILAVAMVAETVALTVLYDALQRDKIHT